MLVKVALAALIGAVSCRTICYNYGDCDLGCFTDDYPWGNSDVRPLSRIPLSPVDVNAQFYLDTKYQKDYLLDPTDPDSIYRSGYRPEFDTKIIIHGYTDAGDRKWMYDLSGRLLMNDGDLNVIRVNWWDAAENIDYAQSSADTQVVGGMAMCLLKEMYKQDYGMLGEKVHCIGHSLGAQACGYVGRNTQLNFTQPIARITGLDPAEPYFGYAPATVALDPSDALFVDAIHTDTVHFRKGVFTMMPEGMGVEERVGHMDYYPNNGTDQPGCDQGVISTITGLEGLMNGARDFVACNHLRSIKFFNESLELNTKGDFTSGQKCKFTAFECSYEDFKDGNCMSCANGDCPSMGLTSVDWIEDYGSSLRSAFVLDTAGADLSDEYCTHSTVATINMGPNTDKTKGQLWLSLYGTLNSTTQEPVTDSETTIKGDTSYTREIDYATDVGDIQYVKFMWEKDEWTVTRHRMYVSSIDVYWGDEQKTYSFCNQQAQMEDNVRYTFQPC